MKTNTVEVAKAASEAAERPDRRAANDAVARSERRFALATALALAVAPAASLVARAAPPTPAPPQSRPIALVGATVHPVSAPSIPQGVVVFERGRITALGAKPALPPDVQTIDVAGKHVYPGLFDPYTNLGLSEIGSVAETVDEREFGQINPNARAIAALHVDSEIIPVTRANGVLLALVAPTGPHLSGLSTVVQLDGWTWEAMALKPDAALHVEWPSERPQSEWIAEKSIRDQRAEETAHRRELRRAFEQADAYRRARRAPGSRQPIDARWEAMLPVLEGRTPVVVYADDLLEIESAVAFCHRWRLKTILLGGYDAPLCADLLRRCQVPVVVTGVYRLPIRRSAPYDEPYTLPARLKEAGLKYCISASGALGAVHVRNLANNAAAAVGFGLPPDEALKAITLYPAEILGVADRVGSLEPGKDATLIVTDGDPLATETRTLAAFIQGRSVDLSDRHQRLWQKYRQKPPSNPQPER